MRQTLKDMEIILVDDGSSDGSGAICDALKDRDSRIVVLHTENRGVSAARNAGMAAAQGDYIGFCDADDLLHESFFETLLQLAESNDCEVSMVTFAKTDGEEALSPGGSGELTVYPDRRAVLSDFFSGKIVSSANVKLYRRSLCRGISFDEGRKINEDRMFVFDALCRASSWCYRDVSLYTYVRHSGSASKGMFSEKYLDCVYFAEQMEQKTQQVCPALADAARANTAAAQLQVLKLLSRAENGTEYREVFRKSADALKPYPISFCKKHLRKNDFYKVLILKINRRLFRFVVKHFAQD